MTRRLFTCLAAAVAVTTAGTIALVPRVGGADEEDQEKQRAIAGAPDYRGELPPAEDPTPNRWTRTGSEGPLTDPNQLSAAYTQVLRAFDAFHDAMALPTAIDDRVAKVSDPTAIASRTQMVSQYFRSETFSPRLERALLSVATDDTYQPYTEYELVAEPYSYTKAKGCDHAGVEPGVPCGATAFIVFAGRERYHKHDGTWRETNLTQFQVTLDARQTPLGIPDNWRVISFYRIPLEGEGAGMFEGDATPSPVS